MSSEMPPLSLQRILGDISSVRKASGLVGGWRTWEAGPSLGSKSRHVESLTMTSCPWRLHPPGTRRDIPSGCWRQDTQGWTSLRNRQRQRTERLKSSVRKRSGGKTRKVIFMYCSGGWNLFFCFPLSAAVHHSASSSCRLSKLEACRLSSARGNTPTVDYRLARRRYVRSHRKTFSELRQKIKKQRCTWWELDSPGHWVTNR